jgi:hypothetical protein
MTTGVVRERSSTSVSKVASVTSIITIFEDTAALRSRNPIGGPPIGPAPAPCGGGRVSASSPVWVALDP